MDEIGAHAGFALRGHGANARCQAGQSGRIGLLHTIEQGVAGGEALGITRREPRDGQHGQRVRGGGAG